MSSDMQQTGHTPDADEKILLKLFLGARSTSGAPSLLFTAWALFRQEKNVVAGGLITKIANTNVKEDP